MTIQDAEYLEYSTFEMSLQQRRQKFFDEWAAMKKIRRVESLARIEVLDDKEITCTEWWLKGEDLPTNVWSHNKGQTGGYIQDFKTVGRSIITVGTKKQEALLMLDLEVQVKDNWETPLSSEYKQLYLQNNKQALLINLK